MSYRIFKETKHWSKSFYSSLKDTDPLLTNGNVKKDSYINKTLILN